MGLQEYVIKRIIIIFLLLWVIASVNFLIFNMLPGTTINKYIAKLSPGGMGSERIKQLRHIFGLDRPLHERYLIYLRNMFTFNFGYSHEFGDIRKAIMRALPNTLILMGTSEIASIIFGILIGVIVAYKRGTAVDSLIVTASLFTYSVPVFWLGYIILNTFALQFRWFPAGGYVPSEWAVNPPSNMFEILLGRLSCLVLPAFTLFIFIVGGWILLTRASVLETITEDYVITARAKGLKTRTVLYKHVLKNASLPLITNIALAMGFLITGAIITETVFSYGGMGSLIFTAISFSDIPMMQAIFFIVAVLVVVANFIADLLYGIIDPRIRYG